MNWTIERVKAELPDVPYRTRISRRGYNTGTGQLAGRGERFATLIMREHGSPRMVSVAWETITDALNEHRYILAD